MSIIKLNLLQGLRQKKRVKAMICQVTNNIKRYNSTPLDTEREIDVHKAIALRSKLKEILVGLKLDLQDASRPIQRDILQLAELKDELGFYQALDTKHGKTYAYNFNSSTHEEVRHEAILRQVEVDMKCVELQKELDELYSKVDAFNTSHYVEVEDITAAMLADIAKK